MWRTLKHILGTQSNVSPNDISPNSFNDYFATVGSKLAEQCDDTPHTWDLPQSMYTFDLNPTEAGFIYKQLIHYSDRSNLDILGMDSRLLKIGASAITPSLCNIFNMSIRSGDLPQDWKTNAEITAQYQSLVM